GNSNMLCIFLSGVGRRSRPVQAMARTHVVFCEQGRRLTACPKWKHSSEFCAVSRSQRSKSCNFQNWLTLCRYPPKASTRRQQSPAEGGLFFKSHPQTLTILPRQFLFCCRFPPRR